MTIGVLAFQGDVIEHLKALHALKVSTKEVRSIHDVEEVQGLIIPGGESTVIGKFLVETGLRERIIERHCKEHFPMYGTCAGAILLAKHVLSDGENDPKVASLGLMDITIERNAYGRQTESFEAKIFLQLEGGERECSTIFIRAPKVVKLGKDVEILARHHGAPVLYRQGTLLASTFHPELSEGLSALHRYFLSLVETPV